MRKDEIKHYLIIFFVVVELLSMMFNFYFVKMNIGTIEYNFNFSIVFFCLGFFVVDIVADKFSPAEAKKFIFYKLFSQSLFLILGNIAIVVYGLEETQLAAVLQKSPWVIVAGLVSTYMGFHVMSSIMSYMKMGVYQGTSVFRRYLCSTIPGELLFSLVFTFLCFYKYSSFDESLHMFMASAVAKIVLSTLFASIMSVVARVTFLRTKMKERQLVKAQAN